jgi:hypothetical protein
MMFASAADIAIVTSFAAAGVLMTPLPLFVVGMLFATTLCFALALDMVKIAVFARLRID